MKSLLSIWFFLFCVVFANAQDELYNTEDVNFIKVVGEDDFSTSISLREVYVFAPLHFENSEAIMRYLILKRKTLKVYPYAKLAAETLQSLNDSLQLEKSNRKRNKLTKKMQKYIEEEFSEELKKLTRTEGQLLIKLVYRQTGFSTFDLVKDLRSGWRAFWYSTTARLFNISMKEEFHPDLVEEDYLMEDILQRAFADQTLEYQSSALTYDFSELHNKWSVSKNSSK